MDGILIALSLSTQVGNGCDQGSGGGWLHGGVEGWLMGERAGRPLPGSQVKGNEGRFRERQD